MLERFSELSGRPTIHPALFHPNHKPEAYKRLDSSRRTFMQSTRSGTALLRALTPRAAYLDVRRARSLD
jgi:hypothetical protein